MIMFRFVLIVIVSLALAGHTAVRAASADDTYIAIYRTIQDADQLQAAGKFEPARGRYLEAQAALKKLQSSAPNYNAKAIQFRLGYVEQKLSALPAPKE